MIKRGVHSDNISMASQLDKWIHSFAITDYCTHEKGYTIYKIVSIIFPINLPETLSCVTVWKRFNDVKNLYKTIAQKHKDLQLKGSLPNIKDGQSIFRRFHPNVIQQRKEFILELLDFCAQHPALYKSYAFITFFEASHSPKKCPETVINDEQSDIFDEIGDDDRQSQFDESYTDDYGDRDQNSLSTSISDSCCTITTTTVDTYSQPTANEYKTDEIDHVDGTSTLIPSPTTIAIDSFDYIYEAALEFSDAVRAEVAGNYRDALNLYQRGIDKLNYGANLDIKLERRQIAKDQSEKYLRKLEHIYKNFIEMTENDEQEEQCVTNNIEAGAIEGVNKESLERPIHQLEKFKVIDILDSVMQVQDMTNGLLYIMKAIEKPSSNNSPQAIQLPRNVPFMVSLIAYFNTESKIYLLLQIANGGRLQDYITSYEPQSIEKSSSLASLFYDPPPPTIAATSIKQSKLNYITETAAALTNQLEMATISSINSDQINDYRQTIGNITPPIDALTQDMDVLDIVNYSKKLLKSVSNTLNESRNINHQNKQQSLDLDQLTSVASAAISSSSLQIAKRSFAQHHQYREPIHSTTNNIIPESSIRRWASEIVTAISYLHSNDIICMDLHTNNLLLGSNGQMLLSYFYRQECLQNCSQRKLSIEAIDYLYVAPERPLTIKSDWWSFGVILFELMTSKRFLACHPGGVSSYFEIQYPDGHGLSMECRDLLQGLIDVNCDTRFGLAEIQKHKFFRNVNWSEMVRNDEIEIEYIYFNPS